MKTTNPEIEACLTATKISLHSKNTKLKPNLEICSSHHLKIAIITKNSLIWAYHNRTLIVYWVDAQHLRPEQIHLSLPETLGEGISNIHMSV